MVDSVEAASIAARVEAIWGRQTSLVAQLCVSVDESYARALGVCRQWFEDGFARLGGPFYEAALRREPADLDMMTVVSRRVPGAISIQLGTSQDNGDPSPCVTYSPDAWDEFLLSLGRVPSLAALECNANDDDGDSVRGPYLGFVVSRIDSGEGTWLVLSVEGSPEMLVPEQRRSVLLDLLRGAAERSNPVHGEVYWGQKPTRGLYEEATGSSPFDSLPRARRALRGYAWLTILPEEIGMRLGGVDGLRASGAFVEVLHLGAGGYWCRATEAPETYDSAAAERVFDVVAAALPPGRPNMWRVIPPNVLSPRDPADRDP